MRLALIALVVVALMCVSFGGDVQDEVSDPPAFDVPAEHLHSLDLEVVDEGSVQHALESGS